MQQQRHRSVEGSVVARLLALHSPTEADPAAPIRPMPQWETNIGRCSWGLPGTPMAELVHEEGARRHGEEEKRDSEGRSSSGAAAGGDEAMDELGIEN